MAPISYEVDPGIGRSTLICGWVFGVVAFVCVGISVWDQVFEKARFGIKDCLDIAAFVISIALTIQTN